MTMYALRVDSLVAFEFRQKRNNQFFLESREEGAPPLNFREHRNLCIFGIVWLNEETLFCKALEKIFRGFE